MDGGPPFDCAAATPLTDIVRDESFVMTYGAGRGGHLAGVAIDSVATGGDACLVFESLGQLDQPSAATVTLSAGGATVTITIDPVTGVATVGS